VTFVDETEGLSNSYESGSESDTPFPPSEDRPNGSPRSSSPSLLSRSVVSPSLGSVSMIPGSDTGHTPSTPENSTLVGNTDSSTLDEQQSITTKPPIFPHNDYAQLPSPNPSTGKALTEEDPVALTYVNSPYGFQSSVTSPALPSIYLDAPVWPLTDPSEAVLLRHFVQNLAIWVGLTRPSFSISSRVWLTAFSWTFVIPCSISRSKFLEEPASARSS
jgi:hypothetical protein